MPRISVHPATPDRWKDLEVLFGPRGACAQCWCMWMRLPSAEFRQGKGEPNKRALRRLVQRGEEPGVIAYVDGEPAGWCAYAPREAYRRLESSRVLAPVDDQPVWSTPCFFIARAHRGKGLATRMLREVVRLAAKRGARVLEGYPVDTRGKRSVDAFVWTGLSSTFEAVGFVEVARRSKTRPIMRRALRKRSRG